MAFRHRRMIEIFRRIARCMPGLFRPVCFFAPLRLIDKTRVHCAANDGSHHKSADEHCEKE